MINTEPKFISPSDFHNYWGMDLNAALKSDNNVSNKANTFLKIVEDRLMAWIDANTARNFAWDDLWQYEWALEHFQKALLEQAMYMYRNSDILMDSGYDPDSGIIAKREDLLKIAVSESAINLLKVGGIFNQVMTNKRRYLDFK